MGAGKRLEDETCSQQAILIRRSPIRKKRSKPRRGQPTKQEKARERQRVYERCGGTCELRDEAGKPLHAKHIPGVLPAGGSIFDRWHLVHKHAKRRFGWTEAQGNTLLGGCYWCHSEAIHFQGKKPA
jgi:hypothetical protein